MNFNGEWILFCFCSMDERKTWSVVRNWVEILRRLVSLNRIKYLNYGTTNSKVSIANCRNRRAKRRALSVAEQFTANCAVTAYPEHQWNLRGCCWNWHHTFCISDPCTGLEISSHKSEWIPPGNETLRSGCVGPGRFIDFSGGLSGGLHRTATTRTLENLKTDHCVLDLWGKRRLYVTRFIYSVWIYGGIKYIFILN